MVSVIFFSLYVELKDSQREGNVALILHIYPLNGGEETNV